MIETTNNIIYWAGYLCIFSLLLLLLIGVLYLSTQKILEYKNFFITIYNRLLEKQFRSISSEQFEKWVVKMRAKYYKIKKQK